MSEYWQGDGKGHIAASSQASEMKSEIEKDAVIEKIVSLGVSRASLEHK